MSTIKSSDDHLTLSSDGSNKDIKFQANGVEKASISSSGAFTSTTIDATKLTGDLPAISGANLTGISPEEATSLTIWAWADAQPDVSESPDQVQQLRDVFTDVNTLEYDASIMAGDIVDRGNNDDQTGSYDFSDYISDLKTLNVPRHRLFHIAGNHDTNYNTPSGNTGGYGLTEYDTYFPRRNYYTLWGNILTIYMSDEHRSTSTRISTEVFKWWEDLVRHNQDKVIITVSHAPLYNTTYKSTTSNYYIENSSRFTDVLDETGINHDIWIHGHNGYDIGSASRTSHATAHGTLHINVGLHIPAALESGGDDDTFDVKSRFMYFTKGSTACTIKMRNHETGAWIASKEISHTLNQKVELSNELVFDGRYQFDSDHGVIRKELNIMTTVLDGDEDGLAEAVARPLVITKTDLRDLNQKAGAGVGIKFRIGGDPQDSEASGVENYGTGATIDAERESGTDTDYSTSLVFQTSTSDDNEASLVESLRLTSDGRGLSQFTAKAWVNFNGQDTLTVNDSHNVSSVTDDATAQYTVNFSNNMANDDYCAVGHAHAGGGTNDTVVVEMPDTGRAVGSLACHIMAALNSATTFTNTSDANTEILIFGD